ncbi:MAG: nuclear transport factor 2 family protein [Parachlamydia sp.]|nr:nuclear transport factor 2 family protein [Parachlamydia sp.]
MRKFFAISIFCLQGLLSTLSAKEADSATKDQITQRLQELTQAINQGDANKLASFWTDEADVSRPLIGEAIEGKAEIVKFLQQRAQELKERKLQFSFKPEKIDITEADQAVVQGVSEISNQQGIFVRNARKVELIREKGQWLIDSVTDIEVPPAPPVYQKLKEIEWLVGNWKDQDEDVTITFANRWDKFNNFVISRFTMDVYGLEAMEGIQIIGFDPVQQKIQSWVFDSDGGFGTGIWTKKGDAWEVAMNYTLSDGQKATGTNVYKKVDDTHYSFSSVDRKLNGQAIPNIEAVTVAKEQQ